MAEAKPYRQEVSEDYGRCLISLKNFSRGDILWNEAPLMWAPMEPEDVPKNGELKSMCLGCCKLLPDDSSVQCPKCLWPCCSKDCWKSKTHKKFECKVLAKHHIPVNKANYEILIFVRVLMSKSGEPRTYKKILNLHSLESRPKNEKKFNAISMHIWNYLTQKCHLNVSETEVTQILALYGLSNFRFDVSDSSSDYSGVGLYQDSSLVTHSCHPNLRYTFVKALSSKKDAVWNIRFYARDAIKSGDLLTMPYNQNFLQYGTVPRQLKISIACKFMCLCNRCKDRTECGTFFQAIACPKKDEGYLLPMNPLQTVVSPWVCSNCEFTLEAVEVEERISELKVVADALLDKTLTGEPSLVAADEFITAHSGNTLHPNHYLVYICNLHWLLNSHFSQRLLTASKNDAESLFLKIVQRADRCIPVCLKFGSIIEIANLLYVAARTYATYMFKTSDMMKFEDGDHSVEVKLKYCRRIEALLKESLVWKRMKYYSAFLERDSKLHSIWAARVKLFEEEIAQRDELTLESLNISTSLEYEL